MISIKNLFRHGPGPSSSHSMHPYRAASDFKDECHNATTIKVTLYGDLARNKDRYFTVQALKSAISPLVARVVTDLEQEVDKNLLVAKFEAFGKKKILQKEKIFYFSKLGIDGDIEDDNLESVNSRDLLEWTYDNGRSVWEYAILKDSSNLEEYIKFKWELMKKSIKNGLKVEGGLPGIELRQRKASLFLSRSLQNRDFIQQISKTLSYTMATIEESACAKTIVAAPTAESSGVIPGVLYTLSQVYKVSEARLIRGLITAGFIGKLLFREILKGDTFSDICIATAMASAGATQIMGGTPKQVIAAAAISLDCLNREEILTTHSLDYIELNALSAAKAIDNATWALLSDNNLSKEIEEFNRITAADYPTVNV